MMKSIITFFWIVFIYSKTIECSEVKNFQPIRKMNNLTINPLKILSHDTTSKNERKSKSQEIDGLLTGYGYEIVTVPPQTVQPSKFLKISPLIKIDTDSTNPPKRPLYFRQFGLYSLINPVQANPYALLQNIPSTTGVPSTNMEQVEQDEIYSNDNLVAELLKHFRKSLINVNNKKKLQQNKNKKVPIEDDIENDEEIEDDPAPPRELKQKRPMKNHVHAQVMDYEEEDTDDKRQFVSQVNRLNTTTPTTLTTTLPTIATTSAIPPQTTTPSINVNNFTTPHYFNYPNYPSYSGGYPQNIGQVVFTTKAPPFQQYGIPAQDYPPHQYGVPYFQPPSNFYHSPRISPLTYFDSDQIIHDPKPNGFYTPQDLNNEHIHDSNGFNPI